MKKIVVNQCKRLEGVVSVPGDKSISHRAVMLGALARGQTVIHNFLMAEDCISTIACFRALGVKIEQNDGVITVRGNGLHGLQEPQDVLDCGNSGTTARLMLGILAGQPFFSVLTGDSSLRTRPMERVVKPLTQMGANFSGRQNAKLLPLAVQGKELKGIHYQTPVASAQLKSAILLAGLFAQGVTVVEEPAPSRDHTERMLRHFGAEIKVDKRRVSVKGRPDLTGQQLIVPGDISSAAFFMVAAAIVPQSDVIIRGVGLNPTRDGIVEVLQNMGADITVFNVSDQWGEPMADLRVRGSVLKGVEIGGDIIPRLIDEIPVLAVAAAVARGKTVFRDVGELRVKETDRIAALGAELSKFGVNITERHDSFTVTGSTSLTGAVCDSHGDHRIAMAMAVAGLVAEGQTVIEHAHSVNISFPQFEHALKSLIVE
ncbi:3-phosphoshikimate 1-carboxyvinyltransferase [Desulfofalx alkaliphila]|uniref:3-phosphoshikimate 1-carboxyvinyltransferase n=1 Tax=Desulfofalx alkaliphila TaxID=105483 RepID=UPI0004E1D0BD|nr:3-phosphoshikimate 1-carboxyvinyltransferase [Desulfofalx alkaliphila]